MKNDKNIKNIGTIGNQATSSAQSATSAPATSSVQSASSATSSVSSNSTSSSIFIIPPPPKFSIIFQLKQIGVALKKEILACIFSPAVYIAILLLIISASVNYFVAGQFFVSGKGTSDLRNFYNFFPYICILIVPVLTMHLWAEEIGGLIFALPLSTSALVLAKWLCSFLILVACQIFLLIVPICVNRFGTIDWGQIFTANFAIFFYFSAVCALGQFFSLLTKNQVTAAILCTIILALINCVHLVPYFFNAPILAKMANAISFAWHFDAASKGILDSRDIIFYSICTAIFLLASIFVIEWRKERE